MTRQFIDKVKKYGPRFIKDLDLTKEQVAGIFGNLYVETGGFTLLQEKTPIVKGSLGGYGWAQWTGPRRRAYESWCLSNNLDKSSDEANYQYIVYELKTTEKNALRALRQTKTVKSAAESFCNKYERPGIPHLASRVKWAQEAYKILNQPNTVIESTAIGASVGSSAPLLYSFPEFLPYIVAGLVVIVAISLISIYLRRSKSNVE